MKRPSTCLTIWLAATLAGALLACSPPAGSGDALRTAPPDAVDTELPAVNVVLTPEVSPPDENGVISVRVSMNLLPDAVAPRIVELYVEHGADLTLVETLTGAAASAAGKQAVGQARSPTMARLLIFSAGNVRTIDSGVLAELRFNKQGEGASSIRLVEGDQVFAPAEANVGLVVSEPVEVTP